MKVQWGRRCVQLSGVMRPEVCAGEGATVVAKVDGGVQGCEKSSVVKRSWRMQEWKRSVRVSGDIEVRGEHK